VQFLDSGIEARILHTEELKGLYSDHNNFNIKIKKNFEGEVRGVHGGKGIQTEKLLENSRRRNDMGGTSHR
jgi:hypothetical protein